MTRAPPLVTLAAFVGLLAVPNSVAAQPAIGLSAFHKADGIPQPHLLAARRLAAGENFWKVPILNVCYREDSGLSQVIIKDPPPTAVADNLYFLGTGEWSAWALRTPGGIVVIDTLNNADEAETYIAGGLRKVGLDPNDIKVIFVSHGHGDHYGGAQYLHDKYGAKIYMGADDVAYATKRAATTTPNRPTGPVPHIDVPTRDGDSLTLGGVTLKVFLTPGHTPGTQSLLIPFKYKGKDEIAAFHGGVTSSNDFTPQAHAAFDQSIDRFIRAAQAAHATAYMANHGAFDDTARKVAHIRAFPQDEPNDFVVGEASTIRWLNIVKECNLNNRDVDAVFAARGMKVSAAGR